MTQQQRSELRLLALFCLLILVAGFVARAVAS